MFQCFTDDCPNQGITLQHYLNSGLTIPRATSWRTPRACNMTRIVSTSLGLSRVMNLHGQSRHTRGESEKERGWRERYNYNTKKNYMYIFILYLCIYHSISMIANHIQLNNHFNLSNVKDHYYHVTCHLSLCYMSCIFV